MHERKRVVEWHAHDLDLFIIIKILRRRLKPRRKINEQPLFAITRRDLELADLMKLARAIAEFFFKLARGGLLPACGPARFCPRLFRASSD